MYEGRSINKLQNGAILSVLKIGKIRSVHFVGNLILIMNIPTTFLDDDVIPSVLNVYMTPNFIAGHVKH